MKWVTVGRSGYETLGSPASVPCRGVVCGVGVRVVGQIRCDQLISRHLPEREVGERKELLRPVRVLSKTGWLDPNISGGVGMSSSLTKH